jgi:mRNA interferase MazF
VIQCGSICWADLGEARGSRPAKRRPVLVIQSGPFNASQLNNTIAAVITSNTALAAMPGNVSCPEPSPACPTTQSLTSPPWSPSTRPTSSQLLASCPNPLMNDVSRGLRLVVGLIRQL